MFSVLCTSKNFNIIIIYFSISGNQQPVMIQQPMAMAPPGYTMEPNGYTNEKYWQESLDWKESNICIYYYKYSILFIIYGSFNNYVEQILSNFDHLPPTLEWTFYICTIYLPFVHMANCGLSTDHLATSSCPRSYQMTPYHVYSYVLKNPSKPATIKNIYESQCHFF